MNTMGVARVNQIIRGTGETELSARTNRAVPILPEGLPVGVDCGQPIGSIEKHQCLLRLFHIGNIHAFG